MRKATTFVNQPSLFDWADSTIEVKVEPSTATKRVTDTPLIAQYHEMKRKHPDAILLFRVGDFYETFAEDAQFAAEILNITLTRRCGSTKANRFISQVSPIMHSTPTFRNLSEPASELQSVSNLKTQKNQRNL